MEPFNNSVGTRATNLVDSTENKINESIVANEKDTFNISSNNLTSTDVDSSMIKLTNQMKKNFFLAKQDFDTYLKSKSDWKNTSNTIRFYYSQRIINKRIVKGSK